jgi:seryl-tRNA synthetase
MFDIKKIRENPEDFDKILSKRNHNPISEEILDLDKKNKDLIAQLQSLQEERNSKSKKIGELSSQGNSEEASNLKQEVSALKSKLQELDEAQKNSQNALNDVLSRIPNLPHESVPVGDETKNKEIKLIGEKKDFSFELKEHFDIGEDLGIMSFEDAANISGARFVIQKGMLSKLERSISNFMLDLHTSEFGYEEVNVPIPVPYSASPRTRRGTLTSSYPNSEV